MKVLFLVCSNLHGLIDGNDLQQNKNKTQIYHLLNLQSSVSTLNITYSALQLENALHPAAEQPPAVVFHTLVPSWPILFHRILVFFGLPGLSLLDTFLGVDLRAAGTQVCDGPEGEDLVVDVGRKGDLKTQCWSRCASVRVFVVVFLNCC